MATGYNFSYTFPQNFDCGTEEEITLEFEVEQESIIPNNIYAFIGDETKTIEQAIVSSLCEGNNCDYGKFSFSEEMKFNSFSSCEFEPVKRL